MLRLPSPMHCAMMDLLSDQAKREPRFVSAYKSGAEVAAFGMRKAWPEIPE